jgi:hypothetical protein
MARCWTCGSYCTDLRYSCTTCLQLNALKEVREAAHAASILSAEKLDAIADLHRKTHEALLDGFDRLNQTMEWGFSGLLWAIDQQSDVLRSIDTTLKTPSQRQAEEWRNIGERLRQRGESKSATKFFVDALKLNPLDYQIYLGLAYAYFELSRFEDADRVLVASLPHAPRSGFDKRSVTYRLLGRIRFCHEEYNEAAKQLRQAVTIEPKYAKGFYDLAQYASCIGAENECLTALRDAIAIEPNFWYASRAEPLFEPLRPQVDALLQSILAAPLTQTKGDLQQAAESLSVAQPKADECRHLASILRMSSQSVTLVGEANNAVSSARAPFNEGDYKAALSVAKSAAAARDKASAALERVVQELEHLIAADKARQAAKEAAEIARKTAEEAAEKAKQAAKEKTRRILFRIFVGVAVYLLIAGSVGFYFEHSIDGFLHGLEVGIKIPLGIAIVIAVIVAIGSS